MSTTLYLSKARLRAQRGEVLSAIAPILVPDDGSRRAALAHRLVWLLFQHEPDRRRDFLWREVGHGSYLILSRQAPTDPSGLFHLGTKQFSPILAEGDRLRFAIHANAVVSRKAARTPAEKDPRARGKRVDVVMDALYAVPNGERAARRQELTRRAARAWLDDQGTRAGFRPLEITVKGYQRIDITDHAHARRRSRAGVSVLDLEGDIEVTDPATFLDKLAVGFGSAKAFGCGLMLIRRA